MSATIRIQDDTKKRFDKLGVYGDTADKILERLLDCYETYNE